MSNGDVDAAARVEQRIQELNEKLAKVEERARQAGALTPDVQLAIRDKVTGLVSPWIRLLGIPSIAAILGGVIWAVYWLPSKVVERSALEIATRTNELTTPAIDMIQRRLLDVSKQAGVLEGKIQSQVKATVTDFVSNNQGAFAKLGSPVGSIVAWHRSIVSPPLELPDGWLACNGQECRIEGSPFFGVSLPDLNSGEEGGVFLRGGRISGTSQIDSTRMPNAPFVISEAGEHAHRIARDRPRDATTDRVAAAGQGGNDIETRAVMTGVANRHTHPITGGDTETRPKNMSVVWIMRVK